MPLLDAIPRTRGVQGRPRHRPGRLFAEPRLRLRQVPPPPGPRHHSEDRPQKHSSRLRTGQDPLAVERTFAWPHRFKRLRIRYEIRADLHLGLQHHLLEKTPDLILKISQKVAGDVVRLDAVQVGLREALRAGR